MSNVVALRNGYVPRWKAVCEYRSESGTLDVEHFFEEIEELDRLIERGPDWNTLIRCTITLNRVVQHGLTVERARDQ